MKPVYLFKANPLTTLLLSIGLLVNSSCNDIKQTGDPSGDTNKQKDEKLDNPMNSEDAQFLLSATNFNLEEVLLGQLAAQNGSSTDIKELGSKIGEEHYNSQRELVELAKTKLFELPTSPTDTTLKLYKDLSAESTKDFDRKYCDMTIKRHEDAIALYENAASRTMDADIRDWATETVPVLISHLDQAKNYRRKIEAGK